MRGLAHLTLCRPPPSQEDLVWAILEKWRATSQAISQERDEAVRQLQRHQDLMASSAGSQADGPLDLDAEMEDLMQRVRLLPAQIVTATVEYHRAVAAVLRADQHAAHVVAAHLHYPSITAFEAGVRGLRAARRAAAGAESGAKKEQGQQLKQEDQGGWQQGGARGCRAGAGATMPLRRSCAARLCCKGGRWSLADERGYPTLYCMHDPASTRNLHDGISAMAGLPTPSANLQGTTLPTTLPHLCMGTAIIRGGCWGM